MNSKSLFYLVSLLSFSLIIGILIGKFTHSSLHKEIDIFLKQNQFQGSVLIAKQDKILVKKGYGYANEESRVPNTNQSVFRIGSITKSFTAIAILQLQEKGRLNVYDPVIKYLPDYPKGDKILIHHLLSHTSGIPSITDFPNLQKIQRDPSTPEQTISYFKSLPLKFTPGTDCEYSDSGYIVLGAIIEAITKDSYEHYIQQNILQPLGMASTYYDHNRFIVPNKAMGYEKNQKGEKFHANYIDMSFPHAAGALATTVDDLYKFDRALKGTQLLLNESKDALFLIHGSSEQNQIAYGYGFFIGPRNQELKKGHDSIVGHSGTIEGFRAAYFHYPDHDVTIILLSNIENSDITSLHLGIAQIVDSYWRLSATS